MFFTLLYCFSLIILLISGIYYRSSKLYLFILAEYVIVGVMSIICIYNNYLDVSAIRFWPYLILIYSFAICFQPLKINNDRHAVFNIHISDSVLLFFVIAYILMSLIDMKVMFPFVKKVLLNADWNTNRDYLYTNEVVVTNNIIEWFAINFTSYFRIIALIVGFIFICLDKAKVIRKILLICTSISVAMLALYGSSRGILLDYILLFSAMFLFFGR